MQKVIITLLLSVGICGALPIVSNNTLAERDAPAITFLNCERYQQLFLDLDLDDMQRLARTAQENVGRSKYWDAVFGQEEGRPNSDDEIRRRYEAISFAKNEIRSGRVIIRCDRAASPMRNCNNGFGSALMTQYAGSGHPMIWVCKSYWDDRKRISDMHVPESSSRYMALDEFQASGSMLLHEWTHALWSTADVKLRETKGPDGTLLVAYGQQNVLRLRREHNGNFKAGNNADSYRVFASMVTMSNNGNEIWSTDPDNLEGRIEP